MFGDPLTTVPAVLFQYCSVGEAVLPGGGEGWTPVYLMRERKLV